MSKSSPEETEKQKTRMLIALEANNFNITKAAKLAKIHPSTYYRWQKEDGAYAKQTEVMRDLLYRSRTENLIDLAFSRAEKGNDQVLNKLLGIFLKNLPEEMRMLRRNNEIPIRVGVRFINTPLDPRRTDHLSPEERKKREEEGK